MAREVIHHELHIIVLSRQEAVNLVGLLVAQLAGVALINNHGGAAPSCWVIGDKQVQYELCTTVEPDTKEDQHG